MSAPITHAMVLAAGLGTRMRARAEALELVAAQSRHVQE